jgi:hypothetical protein
METTIPVAVMVAARAHQSSIPDVWEMKKRTINLIATTMIAISMSIDVTRMRDSPRPVIS